MERNMEENKNIGFLPPSVHFHRVLCFHTSFCKKDDEECFIIISLIS